MKKVVELTKCTDHQCETTTPLTPSGKFRIKSFFLPVIDQLQSEMRKTLEAYRLVEERFGFLKQLDTLRVEEILKGNTKLLEIYESDLDADLGNEIIKFKNFYM